MSDAIAAWYRFRPAIREAMYALSQRKETKESDRLQDIPAMPHRHQTPKPTETSWKMPSVASSHRLSKPHKRTKYSLMGLGQFFQLPQF